MLVWEGPLHFRWGPCKSTMGGSKVWRMNISLWEVVYLPNTGGMSQAKGALSMKGPRCPLQSRVEPFSFQEILHKCPCLLPAAWPHLGARATRYVALLGPWCLRGAPFYLGSCKGGGWPHRTRTTATIVVPMCVCWVRQWVGVRVGGWLCGCVRAWVQCGCAERFPLHARTVHDIQPLMELKPTLGISESIHEGVRGAWDHPSDGE